MSTRVQLANGQVITVETDNPQEAARAAHRFQQQQSQRQTPAYRAAYAREGQVHSSDPGQRGPRVPVVSDFNDFMEQIPANIGVSDEMAALAGYSSQALQNLGHRVRGEPIRVPAATAAQAAADYENDRAARYRREHPNRDMAATVLSIPYMGGRPAQGVGRIGALRAGAAAGAVDAPFALARQEGSLQERLPGAAREVATTAALSAGLTGVVNRLIPGQLPRTTARADQFEAAGVRPTLAAINGGAGAGATKMIGENFVAGAGVRARLQDSLNDTSAAARRIAGEYGQHGQPEQVGETVQAGVRRFAGRAPPPSGAHPAAIPTRDWSFGSKASALYDHVFDRIAADEAAHVAGQTGATATTDATQAALGNILNRVQAPNVAEIVNDPLIGRIQSALQADQGAIRFQDLRALRTWVREARRTPGLRQTIDDASLARLEGALTEDIYTSAIELGGESAAHELRRVDQFYRAGQQRIQRALEPFTNGGGAQAYRRVIDLAREGGRQNSQQLMQLKRSLRPDEWRQVAATVIDELGRPTAGNPAALEHGAFSVQQFVTNYAKLSQEGRQALFGARGGGGAAADNLARELDNLAQVAGYQKGVEAMVNSSRSGVNAQNFGSLVGLANPGTMAPTAGVLGGMALTGEMLTNPAFVRWLVSAQRGGATVGGLRRQLAALGTVAARDPALAPFYSELSRRLSPQSRAPQGAPRELQGSMQ